MKQSILIIGLEFLSWRRAKHLSYCAQLGLEEGLAANNVDFFTIPSTWVYRTKHILKARKFDQVWVELIHSNLDEQFLQWLSELAPVRIGFTLESINYSEQEYKIHSFLKGRDILIKKRMKFMTHLVACDERDVEIHNKTIPSFWWPQAVPKRFVSGFSNLNNVGHAIFCGALYGERKAWLNNPALKKLLVKQQSPENNTQYPLKFNLLNFFSFPYMKSSLPIPQDLFNQYMDSLRFIRQECFKLWLKNMQNGAAVVNLPHLVKTYAGRVVEAMAAGVPVISWEIPDRPRNKALFEDGKEILLFSKNDPEKVVYFINKIVNPSNFAQTVSDNARKKILAYHTIEKRVEQILGWVRFRESPEYYE